MKTQVATLDIRTLGTFQIAVNGKQVAEEWPNEALKVLFCSLLSPLDLSFSWDRICRALWGMPATRTGRRKLDENYVKPLNSFLVNELGFSPLISDREGVRIDQQCLNLDAIDFHNAVVDGLKQFSLGNNHTALEKIHKARLLYVGCFLPGIPGKIVASTRNELESMYRTVVSHPIPITPKSSISMPATGRYAASALTVEKETWEGRLSKSCSE
jgi:hypothetical protein